MNARLAIVVVAIAVAATSSNVAANIIDRSVHRKLASAETLDVIVRFKPSVNVAQSFQEAGHANRGEHITALKAALEKAHAEALSPLANLVAKESSTNLEVKTFWISPVASVKRATLADVLKIAALPNVVQVREARALELPDPIIQSATSAENVTIPSTYEWGVGKIGANKVWTEGKTGEGIRVGAIDTGVRYTHEALRSNFGGDHSWFDPELKTALPHDDSGHGTHTMGTIAGTNGIGVAPGSTWLSCRGCRPDGCWDDDLLGCAQFVFCPTDPNGENADCSKAPRVINNSWGGGQGDDWYADAVAAWLKAGIVPVFSQGNAGPECVTALSSGDYANVIGVGATTSVDGLAAFSSKGPSVTGLVKPDISAPGQAVRSSYVLSDSSYATGSGTSMAAPHVTGAIALLLQAEPELTVDDVKARLYATATQSGLASSGYVCGNTTDDVFPNNQYGYGRLNIFDAYKGVRTPVA